jgi:hypothetical protein
MNMPLEAACSAGRQSTLQHVVAMEVPRLVRDYGDVRLSIYRAKACGRAAWESPALRALVAEARESYRTLYGQQVPIFDHYDQKAWIYVAIATYESRGSTFEEALTLRFVPAASMPLLNDDLNFYRLVASPERELTDVIGAARGAASGVELLRGAYSQSRMGSLRPRSDDRRSLAGNRHVGLSWCLMLDCFLDDSARSGRPCQLLTAQTTEQLRVLGAKVPMSPAAEALGLAPGSIKLNRRDSHVREMCYGVPTYFLNLGDVGALLSRLIADGRLSAAALRGAVAPGTRLERALARPSASSLGRLNLLFDARGPIDGSTLSGDELRELADREVDDGPVLRLTDLERLEVELEELRRSAYGKASASFIQWVSHR